MMDEKKRKQQDFNESAMKRIAPNPKLSPQLHHVAEETSLDPIKKMHRKVQVQVLPTPVKSESDQKEYKVIRLANGLTVCLISDLTALTDGYAESDSDYETDDSKTSKKISKGVDGSAYEQKAHNRAHNQKMAAAALCVGVGGFSDPKGFPGLAHFLEHMVSRGSKKFPRENDFKSFITNRCGESNAATDLKTTIFHFKCLTSDFCRGLAKFAQFFISPLMSRSMITREREAIDSEFQLSFPDDLRRREQLLLNLAKKDTPVKTAFVFGNSKTLRDNVQLSALYNALHEFRKRHYSAQRMTLAIQAALPIELLEAYVLDCFSDVPCNNLPPDNFSNIKDCYDTPEWNKFYFIESVNHTSQVDITFALPPLRDKYKTKPLSYVSWILNNEGKGSLMSYLRKKAWAISIQTGNFEEEYPFEYGNSLYSLFSIRIHLTAIGFENKYTVIESVFSFINMMKTLGPQESIYNEMKQIKDVSFRFAAEQCVDDYVQKISRSMQIHPPEDYLTGPDLFYKFDSKDIKMVMERLGPRKANITVMSKTTMVSKQGDPIEFDKTEKWFDTKHKVLEIPEEYLLRLEKAQPLDEFSLPLPNLFITENFEIVPSSTNVRSEFPVKILQNDAMELWHRTDEKIKLPMAIWYIALETQLPLKTTKNKMMLELFVDLVMIQVAEVAGPAKSAKLSYDVRKSRDLNGMVIIVSGLNQNLPILIFLLVQHLKLFTSNLTEETFAGVKDLSIKEFHNSLLNVSTRRNYNFEELLFEEQTALFDITSEDMKTFAEQFLKQLYVKVLVEGNVSAEQATLVAQNIVRDLNYLNYKSITKNAKAPQKTREQLGEQSPGATIYCMKSLNSSDPNSIVTNYYQGGQNNQKNRMVLEVTVLLIKEPLFDTLRTKEQLGYVVGCHAHQSSTSFLGFSVTVNSQAGKYSTRYVDERIDLFLKQMWKALKDMSESKFEMVKRRLINKKQCQNYNLAEEVSRNWNEISVNVLAFDRSKYQVKCIKEMKLSDVRDLWKKYIYCEDKDKFTYRKTSTQVFGYGSKEDSTQETCREIKFLEGCSLFPGGWPDVGEAIMGPLPFSIISGVETDSFELDFVTIPDVDGQINTDLRTQHGLYLITEKQVLLPFDLGP